MTNPAAFGVKVHDLYQDVANLRHTKPRDISNDNLEPIKEQLTSLQERFSDLRKEWASLESPLKKTWKRQITRIEEDLQYAETNVARVEAATISKFTSGPVTRQLKRDFNILRTTHHVIEDECAEPLSENSRKRILAYCDEAERQVAKNPRLAQMTAELVTEWQDRIEY